MIQNLIFGMLFLKHYFGHTTFLYLSTPSRIPFFDFRFSRKSQSQQELVKKINHFTLQFCSKNLIHFMNLTSVEMLLKTICSRNMAKKLFHFTNFPANMILFGVGKNIFRNGAVPFLNAQELHS